MGDSEGEILFLIGVDTKDETFGRDGDTWCSVRIKEGIWEVNFYSNQKSYFVELTNYRSIFF